jgi:hypothetical protein
MKRIKIKKASKVWPYKLSNSIVKRLWSYANLKLFSWHVLSFYKSYLCFNSPARSIVLCNNKHTFWSAFSFLPRTSCCYVQCLGNWLRNSISCKWNTRLCTKSSLMQCYWSGDFVWINHSWKHFYQQLFDAHSKSRTKSGAGRSVIGLFQAVSIRLASQFISTITWLTVSPNVSHNVSHSVGL